MAGETSGQPNDVLGAGPIMTWGAGESARTVALYHLFGMHERQSPFASTDWMSQNGEFSAGPFVVKWAPSASAVNGIDLYDFEVIPQGAGEYAFGFAVDPDLGTDASNDRSHYDADRRLVYVTDSERAFGILILEGKTSALVGVQQFGAARFPPSSVASTVAALQRSDVRLISKADDVQFLLSTARRSKPGQWTIAFIRGSDANEIQARADALLKTR